jgi:hypothetical protein
MVDIERLAFVVLYYPNHCEYMQTMLTINRRLMTKRLVAIIYSITLLYRQRANETLESIVSIYLFIHLSYYYCNAIIYELTVVESCPGRLAE